MKNKNIRVYNKYLTDYILYTVFFLLITALIVFIFYTDNRSFIWKPDGLFQHFVAFDYLCDFIGNIIKSKSFSVYDFSIGLGGDVFTTLASYDFTDPISWLAALCFPFSRVIKYSCMVFIKLYLVGISFIVYCHSISEFRKSSIVLGAVSYTFSSLAMFTFARHPNFIHCAYYCPFILAGVENYIRKHKILPLILSISFNALASFYCFYIDAIILVIYVVTRSLTIVFSSRKQFRSLLKSELILDVKMALLCFLGVGLVMFAFLPVIYGFVNNGRTADATGYLSSGLHYPVESYYPGVIVGIFTPLTPGSYTTFIGLNTLCCISLPFCISEWRKHIFYKVLTIIFIIILCVPYLGRVMNGFGYATNRWAFPLAFIGSLSITYFADNTESLNTEKIILIVLFNMLYVLLLPINYSNNVKYGAFLPIVFCTVWTGICWLNKKKMQDLLNATIVCCSVINSVFLSFSSCGSNYKGQFYPKNQINQSLITSMSLASKTDSIGFNRVDNYEYSTNTAHFENVNSTDIWWSMIPKNMVEFYYSLGIADVYQNCLFRGLDGRPGVCALSSVKYYTNTAGSDMFVPTGYEKVKELNDKYDIYENPSPLALGYGYTKMINRAAVNDLTPYELEQVMLETAIVEDETTKSDEDVSIDYSQFSIIDFEVENAENASLSQTEIKSDDKKGFVSIAFDGLPDSELYLYFNGVKSNIPKIGVTVIRDAGDEKNQKKINVSNQSYYWWVDRDDVLLYLGNSSGEKNTLNISFDAAARLSFESMKIIAKPVALYQTAIENLSKDMMENVVVQNNCISGDINITQSTFLQFSIPYSKGWKVFVDGEEKPVIRSNIMFMGVEIDHGYHTLQLKYHTPLLRAGMVISAFSLIFIVYFLIRKKRTAPSCVDTESSGAR